MGNEVHAFLTVDGVRCDERFGHNLLIQYHFHIHFRLFPPQIQNFGLIFTLLSI